MCPEYCRLQGCSRQAVPAQLEPLFLSGRISLVLLPVHDSSRSLLASLSSLSSHQKLPSSSHPISPVNCLYEHGFICRAFRGVTSKLLFFPFDLRGGGGRGAEDGRAVLPAVPPPCQAIAGSGQLSLAAGLTAPLSPAARDPPWGRCPGLQSALPPRQGLCVGVGRAVPQAESLCGCDTLAGTEGQR